MHPELIEVLLTCEGTKKLDEDVPCIEVIICDFSGVEHPDHQYCNNRKREGNEEFGKIVS